MWTDERVDTLKKLWLEGLSASQVARELGGVTRNAVIGKINRLGLSGRATTPTLRVRRGRPDRPARRRAGRSPRPSPPAGGLAVAVDTTPDAPGLVSDMTLLASRRCRWPIGDPKADDFSFCGACVEGEGAYCPVHHRRAHQPRKPEALSRDPVLRLLLAA